MSNISLAPYSKGAEVNADPGFFLEFVMQNMICSWENLLQLEPLRYIPLYVKKQQDLQKKICSRCCPKQKHACNFPRCNADLLKGSTEYLFKGAMS